MSTETEIEILLSLFWKIIAAKLPDHQNKQFYLTFISQVSNLKPVTCAGWTRGALVTVALVAAVTIFGALWVEWKA